MADNPFLTAAQAMNAQPAPAPTSVAAPIENPFLRAARAHSTSTENPFVAAARAHAVGSTRPSGTPKPKLEMPKEARENPLRTIGDVLEAPFAVMHAYDADYTREQQAIGRGERGGGFDLGRAVRALKPGTDTARAMSMMHDPHALAEEYGAGELPELARESAANRTANPNGSWFDKPVDLAAARQKNPALNAVATIGEEFLNPANAAAGTVAGQALRYAGVGVKAARAASPALDRAASTGERAAAAVAKPVARAAGTIGRPIGKVLAPAVNTVGRASAAVKSKTTEPVRRLLNSFFSKYGDIENAAGSDVADVARAIDKRPAIARKAVEHLTNQVFGKDLTREQKLEVVRRSYVDDRNNRLYPGNSNIEEPKSGLSLDDRAALYRGAYNRVTPLLQRFGLLKDETHATGTYDPRKRFGREIYAGDGAKDETAPFVPVRAMQVMETGGSGGGFGIKTQNQRRYDDRLLTDIPDAELHEHFDPAHQFFHDLVSKHSSISNELNRGRLERVYPIKPNGQPIIDPQFGAPVPARTPTKYANDKTGEFFGYGAEGEGALDKALRDRANEYATKHAAGDFTVRRDANALQITPDKIAAARGLDARILGVKNQISEAARAGKTAGQLAEYVTSRYAAQRDRIGTELLTAATRQAKRVDSLNEAIEAAQAKVTQGAGVSRARQFAAMVDERERETQRLAGVVERVEHAASPLGLSAKSGYAKAFTMVDALPKQLAAKMRPLIENAGDVPNAETLAAARAMLRSSDTPEARGLMTELERLATRTTTGKLDGLRDAIDNIRLPDAERGLAGIERANAQRGTKVIRRLDAAIGKSQGIQDALRSSNETAVTAAKGLVQQLKEADALRVDRPNITGNADVDAYLFEQAKSRGTRPAYMERFRDIEDAAGNYDRTVRTSGNAQQSAETKGYDFTPNDITAARKFMAEHLDKVPSRREVLDQLQRAMQFDQSRKGDLAELVEQYGSAPNAVQHISQALRDRLAVYQKSTGAVEGATAAANPFLVAAKRMREDSAGFDSQLGDRAKEIRAAQPGGAGYANTVKRLGAIGRAAQDAPGKAASAATAGALASQAQAMARAARAGVDGTGQRIIGDMHREAQAAEREVERVWDSIYGTRDKLARPSEDAMYAAQGKGHMAGIRAMMLGEKKATLEELARARENYDRVYQQHFDEMLSQLRREYGDTAQAPAGYVKEVSGSPTGKDKFLIKEVADFLNANGKSLDAAGDAKKATDAFSKFNALSRAGIVLLPIAHAVPNLGMAYLATGGSIERMGKILLAQAKFDAKLVARAEKAGATSEGTAVMFGDQGAHEAFTPTRELAAENVTRAKAKIGPLGQLAGPATYAKAGADAVYSGMNRWLFDKVERSYRLDYFDRLTREGLPAGAAARKVSEAFGKVGDYSRTERAINLDKVFYFYPWVKTVVPFWVKHGLVDPAWVDAPVRGIEANNEQQGYDDPSKPFTATAGKRTDGEWRRYKVFLPQAVDEMLAQVARAPIDAVNGDLPDAEGDAYAPIAYAQGHLNTLWSVGLDLAEAAKSYAMHAHPSPFNTFNVDQAASLPERLASVGTRLAQKVAAPIEQGARVLQDPASIGSVIAGGFVYGEKSEADKRRQHAVSSHFARAIAAAKARHDASGLLQLYSARAAAIQAATSPPPARPASGLGALYSPR